MKKIMKKNLIVYFVTIHVVINLIIKNIYQQQSINQKSRQMVTKMITKMINKFECTKCGKIYKFRSGLSRHKKKCNANFCDDKNIKISRKKSRQK